MKPSLVFVGATFFLWVVKTGRIYEVIGTLTTSQAALPTGAKSDKPAQAIDPVFLKFLFALLAVGLFIEILDRIAPVAAWSLDGIILFGMAINNPSIQGFFEIAT